MKIKILLLNLLMFAGITGFGQQSGNVTIYSNTGKKFFVILNGIRQNQEAETNVNISGLTEPWYKCRILAEDKSFSIEKNIGVKMDSVVTYQITGKKKKYKLRYYSEAALGGVAPTNQVNIPYQATENQPSSGTGGQSGSTTQPNGQVNTGVNGTSTGTTNGTTTVTSNTTVTNGSTTNGTGQGGSLSIGINMNENGGSINSNGQNGTENVNINVNISGNGTGTNVTTSGGTTTSTYEETVTTTSSSTTINGVTTSSEQTTITTNVNGVESTSTTGTGHLNTTTENSSSLNFDPTTCMATDVNIATYRSTIENTTFSDDQLRIANEIALNRCLTVEQIRSIALLLTFSEDRMTFVQTAYANCVNPNDFMLLEDLFTFSTDKETLQEFVNSH